VEIKINTGALVALALAGGVGFLAGRATRPETPAAVPVVDHVARNENARLSALVAEGAQREQTRLRARACINQLKMIDSGKEQWAMDHRKTSADTPTASDLYGADKYLTTTPECPDGGVYTICAIGTAPTCSLGNRHTASPDDDHVLP
jgi:hypothetical protein